MTDIDQDSMFSEHPVNLCYVCREECEASSHLCGCTGGVAYAHENCLIDWIKTSKNIYCQFCLQQYKIPFYSKYIILFYRIVCIIIDSFPRDILEIVLYTGIRWDDEID